MLSIQKLLINSILLTLFFPLIIFGQQNKEPFLCQNPGTGFDLGGAFSLESEFKQNVVCLNSETPNATINIIPKNDTNIKNAGYIFNFTDGQTLNNFPSVQKLSYDVSNPGKYWVLQGANSNTEGGIPLISCRSIDVIYTEKPEIEISPCNEKSLTITFLNSSVNQKHQKYRIIWGDENNNSDGEFINITQLPLKISHTYTSPPNGKPLVVGISKENADCTSSPIQLINQKGNPSIDLLEGFDEGKSNKITFSEGSANVDYRLEQRVNSGKWTDTGKFLNRSDNENTKSMSLSGFDTKQQYCFRLSGMNGCGLVSVSNELCTLVPQYDASNPKKVPFTWTSTSGNVKEYIFNYSEYPSGENGNTISPTPINTPNLTLEGLDCSKKYQFYITAHIQKENNGTIIVKSPIYLIETKSKSTLSPISVASVNIENPRLIQFSPSPYSANDALSNIIISKYHFYRQEGNSGNFQLISESDNLQFPLSDSSVNSYEKQYCYKVSYEDECSNVSEKSEAFCSILLKPLTLGTIQWTALNINTISTTSSEYVVETIAEDGNIKVLKTTNETQLDIRDYIEEFVNTSKKNPTLRIKGVQYYKININGTLLDFPLYFYSNPLTIEVPAQVYFPTAFTPNADEFNPNYRALGRFIADFNLKIFDRWGRLIFEGKSIEQTWDGTESDGSAAAAGNYTYIANITSFSGKQSHTSGLIQLLR